jgi:hypothetical protein
MIATVEMNPFLAISIAVVVFACVFTDYFRKRP